MFIKWYVIQTASLDYTILSYPTGKQRCKAKMPRVQAVLSYHTTLVYMLWARFVKVYRSHKLCRNVHSHNRCWNASGITHALNGCGNAVCNFLNQVHKCQNFALI